MRILISTDGSEFSRAAVEKSFEIIVSPEKTAIKIVSVFEVLEPLDISISPEFSQELESSARKKAQEFAGQAAARVKERFPQIDLTTQISLGAPDEILIAAAKQWQADLIIIGSHGRGFWGRMLLGSITDSLVHHAPCSVLVVRGASRENA
ncbi:MAG TPA: universal stress protein [Pyrinomonadaceae bacterium]|jgi:nucleotide-binding universal stress UspA family protein